MNRAVARESLERHGLAPDAAVETLAAVVEGRGWRALATRSLDPDRPGPRPRARLVSSGPSARHALVVVLTRALEREPDAMRGRR